MANVAVAIYRLRPIQIVFVHQTVMYPVMPCTTLSPILMVLFTVVTKELYRWCSLQCGSVFVLGLALAEILVFSFRAECWW